MLKSRIVAAIAGSLLWVGGAAGPGHDQGRRQPADERPERGARRDLLTRRQHRGEPHQRRQDALEETRTRDRGQPGDPARRRRRDEQARQRHKSAVRAQRLYGRFQGDRADRRSREGRQHQRRRGRPGPRGAWRLFLERDPAGQFRGRGFDPLRGEREGTEEHRTDLRRRSARRGGTEGAARAGAEGGRQAGRRAAGSARNAAVRLDRRQRAPAQARRDLHCVVRHAGEPDHQAVARQRHHAAADELLGDVDALDRGAA